MTSTYFFVKPLPSTSAASPMPSADRLGGARSRNAALGNRTHPINLTVIYDTHSYRHLGPAKVVLDSSIPVQIDTLESTGSSLHCLGNLVAERISVLDEQAESTNSGARPDTQKFHILPNDAPLSGFGLAALFPPHFSEGLSSSFDVSHDSVQSYLDCDRPGKDIAELRRLSGLTWDQLASLFSVNRRSLHFWASGQKMTPSNQEHLQRLLMVVRAIDRGSASANRALLLGARPEGLPLDLLAGKQYEIVVSTLGTGKIRRITPPSVAAEAIAARAPRPPSDFIDALQDRVHEESGAPTLIPDTRMRRGR